MSSITETPRTSAAAGFPSKDWEKTANSLYECSLQLEQENNRLRQRIQMAIDNANGRECECPTTKIRQSALTLRKPEPMQKPETLNDLSLTTGSAGSMAERNLGVIRIRLNPRSMSGPNAYGLVELDITITQARELRTQIIRAIRGKPNPEVRHGGTNHQKL